MKGNLPYGEQKEERRNTPVKHVKGRERVIPNTETGKAKGKEFPRVKTSTGAQYDVRYGDMHVRVR